MADCTHSLLEVHSKSRLLVVLQILASVQGHLEVFQIRNMVLDGMKVVQNQEHGS